MSLFDESTSKVASFRSTSGYLLFDDHNTSSRSNDVEPAPYVLKKISDDSADGIVVLGDKKHTPAQDSFAAWNSDWTGRILNNLWFKRGLAVIIVIYSIVAALSTTNVVSGNESVRQVFEKIRMCFLGFFTTEVSLRLIRHQFNPFRSGWLFFDISVVAAAWFIPEVLVLRTLRILRSLRHASRIQYLKEIVLTLGRAAPRTLAVIYFLFMIFYIFGVVFTSHFKDSFEEFRRLDITMMTLFQIMTLDSWSELVRQVGVENPLSCVGFLLFIALSTLISVNFVIAIVIHAFVSTTSSNKEESTEDTVYAVNAHDARRIESKLNSLVSMVEVLQLKQVQLENIASSTSSITDEVSRELAPEQKTKMAEENISFTFL
mmetsp:Transcript_13803/g.21326  ORF Transcript_13803/g.21326 Transcript_13803/m.21326 type:complete len:375 (+) Transcript_13803:110-1234(+)